MPLNAEYSDSALATDTETLKSCNESEVAESKRFGPTTAGQRGSFVQWLKELLQNKEPPKQDDAGNWHAEEGARRSADIDRYLAAESSRASRHADVLVLGVRGPVDLLWKQMKLVSQAVPEMDQEGLCTAVRLHIVQYAKQCMYELVQDVGGTYRTERGWKQEMEDLMELEDVEAFAQRTLAMHRDDAFHEYLRDYDLSWADKEKNALGYTSLPSPTCPCGQPSSIIEQLSRVSAAGYVPTGHDYLHFDRRLSGKSFREATIQAKSHYISFIDLRGSGERKKWIHIAADCRAVVYVTDMAAYEDKVGLDCPPLAEDVLLFDSVAHSRWFEETPLLLVFCNKAGFLAQLESYPLRDWRPDFKGGTPEEAVQFVQELFQTAARGRSRLHSCISDVYDEKDVQSIVEFLDTTVS